MGKHVDILNREQLVQDILDIIQVLSKKEQGGAFALDGEWGIGKTYILDELEKQLEVIQKEETADDRYFVFHYNCWQYDYYEEPSVAIVSAMKDKADAMVDVKIKGRVTDAWKEAKNIICDVAGKFIESKIGIDVVELCKNVNEQGETRAENERKFDSLFAFKQTLDETRKKIEELAEYKTVVFIVDELDRCVPKYAIKVLERLHHIFEGLDGVIVIISVDRGQLEHSVKEIYGDNVDTERYLKKFINFRVSINRGVIQRNIFEKFDRYFGMFDDVDVVKEYILQFIEYSDIDIRNLEKIFEKIELIHELSCDKVVSSSVMLFEILWGIIKHRTLFDKTDNARTYGRYGVDMSWIPEITQRAYGELNNCFNGKFIDCIKKIVNNVENGRVQITNKFTQTFVKENALGITIWIFGCLFMKEKLLCVENEEKYKEQLEICRKFNQMGVRLL